MTKKTPPTSPEALMIKAQTGDNAAYAQLLEYVSHELQGFLIGRISSEGDRDDVLQEILISIHKARHTYDGKRLLMPWVYAIAKFRLSDYLRKHYKNPSKNSVEYTEVQEHLLVDVTNEVSDDESNVVSLLEKLPKKQRIIVTRMKLEGYTAKEVGKELGMNTSAVKVAAHRAYQKLREEFKKLENERP